MKILFVSRFLPHPGAQDSGGQDVYHYIDSLSERHSTSLIAFVSPGQEDAVAAMQEICRDVVAVPYRETLPARLWRAGWRILLPRVYGRVISPRYWRRLRDLLSRRAFDLVIVEGMMAPYGRLVRSAKRVLDEIDVYFLVAYQMASNEERFLPRLWNTWDWLRLQAAELSYIRRYDGVLVRSEKDREILKGFLPRESVEVLYPWFEGLDTLQEIPPRRPPGNRILYVGAMSHPPNVEAACTFAQQVFPLIRKQIPDARFDIVGGNPASKVEELSRQEGITVTGGVPDLTPYYARSAVNVVPLRTGGGIIVKTLNGLAAARPTVATSTGCSGIDAQDRRDLIVADDDPVAFAGAVIEVLRDSDLWARLAISGRRYVIDRFRWSAIVQDLETFLLDLIEDPRSHARLETREE